MNKIKCSIFLICLLLSNNVISTTVKIEKKEMMKSKTENENQFFLAGALASALIGFLVSKAIEAALTAIKIGMKSTENGYAILYSMGLIDLTEYNLLCTAKRVEDKTDELASKLDDILANLNKHNLEEQIYHRKTIIKKALARANIVFDIAESIRANNLTESSLEHKEVTDEKMVNLLKEEIIRWGKENKYQAQTLMQELMIPLTNKKYYVNLYDEYAFLLYQNKWESNTFNIREGLRVEDLDAVFKNYILTVIYKSLIGDSTPDRLNEQFLKFLEFYDKHYSKHIEGYDRLVIDGLENVYFTKKITKIDYSNHLKQIKNCYCNKCYLSDNSVLNYLTSGIQPNNINCNTDVNIFPKKEFLTLKEISIINKTFNPNGNKTLIDVMINDLGFEIDESLKDQAKTKGKIITNGQLHFNSNNLHMNAIVANKMYNQENDFKNVGTDNENKETHCVAESLEYYGYVLKNFRNCDNLFLEVEITRNVNSDLHIYNE